MYPPFSVKVFPDVCEQMKNLNFEFKSVNVKRNFYSFPVRKMLVRTFL